MTYLERRRPQVGARRFVLDLEPLEIELTGLDSDLADQLERRYSPYSRRTPAGPAPLRIEVVRDDVDYYLEPPAGLERVQVRIACEGERVRFMSYQIAGWFDVGGPRGRLLLARGSWEPAMRSFENYIRAAVAWHAIGLGGALVHAASAVHRDRAYLFYGESGAGKSTLSECNRRGRILSDDLSLVLPADDGKLHAVGSPFRGTYEGGPPVRGRFPLAAGFRLIQAPSAEVRPVERSRAFAELVGNLPFVAEAFAERLDLFARALTAFSGIPLAHLHFTRDDSYWDAIASAGY